MNVDILSHDPSWWYYFPIAGGFLLFTFAVWIFFKRYDSVCNPNIRAFVCAMLTVISLRGAWKSTLHGWLKDIKKTDTGRNRQIPDIPGYTEEN